MNNKEKKISIYVRNKDITPSSYYRIVQYANDFDGRVSIRSVISKKIYEKHLNTGKEKKAKRLIVSVTYYMIMILRVIAFLLIDMIKNPNYIIISKCVIPRYTPYIIRILLKFTLKKSVLYWDFDDYIFGSGEISKSQAEILEKYSENIIVTNEFLKSKISEKYQGKVILMPTTDGDMQGIDKKVLLDNRLNNFDNQVNLVWVATSGNIPHLIKIIPTLDKAAKNLKQEHNKQLSLTIVCNKSVNIKVNHLNIVNIKWTRKKAMEEIYNAHIGIMPLINKEYSLGKGGFKLVQYLSTGLPVIASNVGYNKEVVNSESGILVNDKQNNDGWETAILKIVTSENIWRTYSYEAYIRWSNNFSYNKNLETWKALLNK